ncbi:HAD-IC family P-type ATPase, partial [Acidimicrobiaceae bacterium USS-CC1]|nr:HAD-IC family P-type ATPase [Acidiferrimicrobium australe]
MSNAEPGTRTLDTIASPTLESDAPHHRRQMSMWDPELVRGALRQSLRKLDPRALAHNPVMFVVEVGSLFTTADAFRYIAEGRGGLASFTGQIAIWLWLTVLFANFSEAMAEGRGQAHANELRRTRVATQARRLTTTGVETVPGTDLEPGDVVVVTAGEVIPGDGEVIEGIASVDESAITGESAPVVRESGGDRSAVTGGTTVLSDEIKVRITAGRGESFLDRMISL